MSYQRAHELANQLRRNHNFRMAERRMPNLYQSAIMLYEIGLRNGYPVNAITGAIVTSGYKIGQAASSLGMRALSTITEATKNK